MRFSLGLLALLALLPTPSVSQRPCELRGVWQLVSGKYGDYTAPATWRQIKIITSGHFAFVGESDRGVKDMKSAADSLQAFRTMFSGGGTYTLTGNRYTEKLEYFADPAYLGMSMQFDCRTDGDRFIQTGTLPIMEGGKKVGEVKLEEVWRRIERL
jgi:hypothetical protein